MQEMLINIVPASSSDMLVIEQLAKEMDLDMADISREQFIAAKRLNEIIGFGRMRTYAECREIATVGVIRQERGKGIGSMVVHALISRAPSEVFVTCVIPDFFKRFGFQSVEQYPSVLQKKVDFCKCFNFTDEQIFVMKFTK